MSEISFFYSLLLVKCRDGIRYCKDWTGPYGPNVTPNQPGRSYLTLLYLSSVESHAACEYYTAKHM